MYRQIFLLILITLCVGCQAQQPKEVAISDSQSKKAQPTKPHDVEYVMITADQCPKDYFRHPLDEEVSLTGTFAEIRPNHYHSGIDLRIGGKVGSPVYAAQEGYVSRINISPWGGGKVLYIDHPNGYRTVYMHLNDYVGEIGRYVKDYQYEHECYAFDINIPAGTLPVKKGQLVAHAGNSGSSGGPHLHYEIRLATTDQTINPLYFGMQYSDPLAPEVRGIRLYPKGGDAVEVKGDEVRVASPFYAGIYTIDRSEANAGKNGPERIELFVDDTLFFQYQAASFIFEESRNVNALIDYPRYQKSREYYIITRQLPGLRAPNHKANNHGWIEFHDTLSHKLTYYVYDAKGNRTRKSFTVRSEGFAKGEDRPSRETLTDYRKGGEAQVGGCRYQIAPFALYDNDRIVTSQSADPRFLTSVYGFRPEINPLPPHVPCTVRIPKPKQGSNLDKIVVVSVNGTKYSACTTTREGDCYCAKVKEFGNFALMQDLEAPTVKPVNFKAGQNVASLGTLRIKVTDNLSGLQSYACYLDGKWTLAEYDGKTASLYVAVKQIAKGSHTLRVVVTDAVDNQTEKEYRIVR